MLFKRKAQTSNYLRTISGMRMLRTTALEEKVLFCKKVRAIRRTNTKLQLSMTNNAQLSTYFRFRAFVRLLSL